MPNDERIPNLASKFKTNQRGSWFHYDDRRVSCVQEADVLGDGHQRTGYIFFYQHKDLCSQLVSAASASVAP